MTKEKTSYLPFLDNTGTRGAELRKIVQRNRNRISRVGYLKREALKLSFGANEYRRTNKLTPDEDYLFEKIIIDTKTCSNYSVFREFNSDRSLQYVHSFMCDNRVCPVCNSERSKVLQRKYANYFKENAEIFKDYNFMHLTLTVPHSKDGFKGERFYMNYMREQFNLMRKEDFWKEMVFAGEYSFEFTRNENGIHCHIHALLLVHKFEKNRNLLHQQILGSWNLRTADENLCNEWTDERIQAIIKGNKQITEQWIRNNMTPDGSTLTGLESLYVMEGGKKRYVKEHNENDMIKGIMETLKYHFEPLALKSDKTDSYDFDLLREILPKIYHKSLYQKFGAFYGEKALNIKTSKTDDDGIKETLEETANDEVIHPVTFEKMEREEYAFILVNPKDIFCDKNNDRKPFMRRGTKTIRLPFARTLPDALMMALSIKIKNVGFEKNKPEAVLTSNFI